MKKNSTRGWRQMRLRLLTGAMISCVSAASAATLNVGPGMPFDSIDKAMAKAAAGDTIRVHPQKGNTAYSKVAVTVNTPGLTIIAVPDKSGARVKLSGKGADTSGAGSAPRGLFEFRDAADGCTLEGFELFGAHNDSHNGAGVRINEANHITIRNCEVHHNDDGAMANGEVGRGAINQLFENCIFHHNGDDGDPGQNHNFYMGGDSITLRGCEIYSSLTGHNVKTRAHLVWIEACYIHDSNNREFDFVDSPETSVPGSHVVLLGNIIVKDPKCPGNRAVMHFGQDGGKEHDGTLYLIHNTIVTNLSAMIVDVSAPKAGVVMIGNIITDGGANASGQELFAHHNGANAKSVLAHSNWVSSSFGATCLRKADGNVVGHPGTELTFVNPAKHDYHIRKAATGVAAGDFFKDDWELPARPGSPPEAAKPAAAAGATKKNPPRATGFPKPAAPPAATGGAASKVPKPLSFQYSHPGETEPRPADPTPTLGAYELGKGK